MPSQSDMPSKIKEVAREEAQRAAALTKDAARSRAYLYPIRGIIHTLTHPSLFRPLLPALPQLLLLATAITVALFTLTYVPQALFLTLLNGPLAPISAVLLVASESATLTSLIAKRFLLRRALLDTFDAVLVSRGCAALVRGDRDVADGRGPGDDEVSRLGRLRSRAGGAFAARGALRSLLYLLLNLVPAVGPAIYVALQGRKYGPGLHARYFELRRLRGPVRESWVRAHRGGYDALGAVAVLLEMVPVVGVLAGFTNVVGAALWAADLERERSKGEVVGSAAEGVEQESGVVREKDE